MASAPKRNSLVSSEIAHSIAEAVRQTDLVQMPAWDELDILSSNTQIEGIEVFEDEIRAVGDKFEGPINVHVTLNYSEDLTLSETFPGRFEATWANDVPSIESVKVDTSSYYA